MRLENNPVVASMATMASMARNACLALAACLAFIGCDDGNPATLDPDGAGGQGGQGASGGGGSGAEGGNGAEGGMGGSGAEGGSGGSGGIEPEFASRKSNLRFKGGARLQLEFSRILDLPTDQLCAELGIYDCLDRIHTVSLGGVEPYVANIYEAFEATSANAPLVVERVALAACVRRVDLDLASADPVIFADLSITADGRLENPAGLGPAAAVHALFTRALLRVPSPEDIADLIALYRDLEASDETEAPARDWAVLTCLATLTSLESLFY